MTNSQSDPGIYTSFAEMLEGLPRGLITFDPSMPTVIGPSPSAIAFVDTKLARLEDYCQRLEGLVITLTGHVATLEGLVARQTAALTSIALDPRGPHSWQKTGH